MNKDIKYTLITGASSGIGYAASQAFAKRGKNLIIIARRKNALEALKNEIYAMNPELKVIIQIVDLTEIDQLQSFYESLKPYFIETWINNAGFGRYGSVATQPLDKTSSLLRLNIEALTILSTLYVRDYQHQENTQLINISSRGGYTIVPNGITYCASKFYVSAFTEGLARELIETKAHMRAKVLAPAATQTEFGKVANNMTEYDYDQKFRQYHSSEQMAEFLLELYDSQSTVGIVDTEDFTFHLKAPMFAYSGNPQQNQKS